MEHVELRKVTKRFGPFEAIGNLDLTVEKGQFCALLGPSGCGKSTLLRLIAGLEAVSGGQVFIEGRDMTEVAPTRRSIAMVFQSYALYPHMNVRDNIAFSLEVAGVKKAERHRRAAEIAQMLQLQDLLDRRPGQLSGGQRQRVAIGRCLVRDPHVFLFDEPLSNLDAMLRVQMRLELAKLHQELKTTMIYVTHDQVEAMTLADKIVVLDKGRISQVGAPLELYNRPANKFVASFIGSPSMNFIAAQVASVDGRTVGLDFSGRGKATVAARAAFAAGAGTVEVGVRPEHIRITAPDAPGATLGGRVEIVERLGNSTLVHVDTGQGKVTVQSDGEEAARVGDTVGLALNAERMHIFLADGMVA